MNILVAAALLLNTAFAAAPDAATQAPAPAVAEQPASSPEALAAARDLLSATLIDTGSLRHAIEATFETLHGQLVSQTQGAPYYAGLTLAHQRALIAYLDTLPAMVNELVDANTPSFLDTASPRIAAIFTPEEASGIAAFLRSPAGRSILLQGVDQGVRNPTRGTAAARSGVGSDDNAASPPAGQITPTEAELAAASAFEVTAAGRAMTARGAEFSAALEETMRASFSALIPEIRHRVWVGMCTTLEDECPDSLRQLAQSPP